MIPLSNMPSGLSPEKMNALLKLAGQKLGRDPETLKKQIESGQMDQVTQGMSPEQAKQVQSMLQNPKAIGQILENPQVKRMLGDLMKGK